MNTLRVKKCSTCKTEFNCGDSVDGNKCWCNDFPPIFAPSDVIDCLCPNCFKEACSVKIDKYVQTVTPESAHDNIAKDLPLAPHLIEGIDYYLEDGKYVFKSWYHLKRGHCCNNNCRHCPYKLKDLQ